jgi:hypothetical protein
MKKLFSLFLLFGAYVFSFGQSQSDKVDIVWGSEIKTSRNQTLEDIIGTDKEYFYALKSKACMFGGAELTLEKFDYNANPVESKELEIDKKYKDHEFSGFFYSNSNTYILTSCADSKTKIKSLYMHLMNMPALEPTDDSHKITDIDYEGHWKMNSGKFQNKISKDGSKRLILNIMPRSRGDKQQFAINVFDNKLEPLWNKEITMPYNDELFDIEGQIIDNEGAVYLKCIVYNEKRRKKRHGEPNYKYLLLKYTKDTEAPEEYPISLPDKFITDINFSLLDNHDITCAGFYSEKGTYSIKGVFYVSIDAKSKQIKKQSLKEFSIDVLVANLTERQKEKVEKKIEKGKEVEMYDYDLRNLIYFEDGSAILCAEQYAVNIVSTYVMGPNGTGTYVLNTYYEYDDIIAVKINPNGDIDWVTKIPKRQYTMNDNGFFSSYFYKIYNNKIYFLYNDHPDNLLEEINNTKKFKNFTGSKNSMAVLAVLDYNGNLTREALFKNKDTEVILRPKVCNSIAYNQAIIFGQKGRTQRFGKMTFK